MQHVLIVNKPLGMTPLQVIEKLKQTDPAYEEQKITYAGRLDPMAHGVLLLVVGDEIKRKSHYLSLPKTYEFTVLFGVETDTYDLLGIVQHKKENKTPENVKEIVNTFVRYYEGAFDQEYPPYSSKTVNGKPLFWWAKMGKLHEITIPKRPIEIYSFELLSFGSIEKTNLHQQIRTTIPAIQGDFRQKAILEQWENYFRKTKHKTFTTATFRISCSSGTYVRGLAHELGNVLNCGAIAIDIFRTAIGEYTIQTAMKINYGAGETTA